MELLHQRKSSSFLSLSIVILSTVYLLLGIQSNSLARAQSCHLRELDLCAATLLVFTQSPGGLATSDSDINKQCVHLKDADSCLRNYTRRCLTPMQREVVALASNSSMELINEYCTRNSQLRNNYLKHAQCLNQIQKKEQKVCMKELLPSMEVLTSIGGENRKKLQLACCSYNKFESCFGGHLEKKCGKAAVSFVADTLRRVTSRLPETMCNNYRPDSQECRSLLPKSGLSVKGSKSSSIVSRLLAAYTGL